MAKIFAKWSGRSPETLSKALPVKEIWMSRFLDNPPDRRKTSVQKKRRRAQGAPLEEVAKGNCWLE